MNISRPAIVFTTLILISTLLDVVSTHVGVVVLGNGEVSPIARAVMRTLGSSWWVFYYPYEAGLLLLAFFGVRFLRTKLSDRISSGLLKIPVEYLILLASYATILNNMIQLLIRLGAL